MNELQTIEQTEISASPFENAASFEQAQRMAKALGASDLVPKQFQGERGLPNTLIALELASRTHSSPIFIMQNLHIIQGKPSFSSQFIIAQMNASGRFSPIRYDTSGEGDERGCIAWAICKETGDRLESPRVTITMAKAEGWHGKSGSKWKTMPDLMLRYRSAAFFGRTYAPDLLLGLQTAEEVRDITLDPTTGEVVSIKHRGGVSGLKARLIPGQEGDADA